MRKKHLEKYLQRWTDHGIMSRDQASAILQLEQQTPSRSWVVFGIAFIGITAMSVGIISLVAANWERISFQVKLLSYFALQLSLGIAVLVYDRRLREGEVEKRSVADVYRETFLVLYALLFFAGIGITGQIFNLSGPAWKSIGFWSLLALPSALACRQIWFSLVWLMMVHLAGLDLTFGYTPTTELQQRDVSIRGVWHVTCALMTMLPLAVRSWPDGRVGSALARMAGVTGALGFVVVGSIAGNMGWYMKQPLLRELNIGAEYLTAPWMALVLGIVAVMRRVEWPSRVRLAAAIMMVTTGIFVTIPFFVALIGSAPVAAKFLGACGFIGIWSLVGYMAVLVDRRWIFELAAFCIASRLWLVYFEVFGSLVETGVGLVVSGALILGLALGWYRFKGRIIKIIGAGERGVNP